MTVISPIHKYCLKSAEHYAIILGYCIHNCIVSLSGIITRRIFYEKVRHKETGAPGSSDRTAGADGIHTHRLSQHWPAEYHLQYDTRSHRSRCSRPDRQRSSGTGIRHNKLCTVLRNKLIRHRSLRYQPSAHAHRDHWLKNTGRLPHRSCVLSAQKGTRSRELCGHRPCRRSSQHSLLHDSSYGMLRFFRLHHEHEGRAECSCIRCRIRGNKRCGRGCCLHRSHSCSVYGT